MKILRISILILLIAEFGSAQTNQTDSILARQNSTLQQICREIKVVGTELSKIDSSKFRNLQIESNIDTNTFSELGHNISETIEKVNEKSFGDMIYNSFGDLISALIAAFIAMWVFYRQWKKEREKEAENKLQEINEKNQYLKSILTATIGLSEKYKTSVEEFTSEIDNNPYEIPDIKLYPLQEFQRLQRIVNNEEYFHAYLNKYGNSTETINNYRTISSLSDYLASQIAELQKKDYKLRDHDRKVDYVNKFYEILEDVNKIGKSNEHKDHSIFIAFDKILADFHPHIKDGFVTDLSIGEENFLEPLKDEILENHFDKEGMQDLIIKIAKASRIYHEIPFQNEHTKKQFKQFEEIMDEVLVKMKEESKHIIKSSD